MTILYKALRPDGNWGPCSILINEATRILPLAASADPGGGDISVQDYAQFFDLPQSAGGIHHVILDARVHQVTCDKGARVLNSKEKDDPIRTVKLGRAKPASPLF